MLTTHKMTLTFLQISAQHFFCSEKAGSSELATFKVRIAQIRGKSSSLQHQGSAQEAKAHLPFGAGRSDSDTGRCQPVTSANFRCFLQSG